MDADGYPDEAELAKIQAWPCEDCRGLMAFIGSLWRYSEHFRQSGEGGRTFKLSTMGWSRNESLIAAMEANVVFWMLCWVSSRRGGHYEFEVPKTEMKEGDAT